MEYFPRLTSLEMLQKFQKDLEDQNIEPEHFGGRIIFTLMFNTSIGRREEIQKSEFRITRRGSREDTGHS